MSGGDPLAAADWARPAYWLRGAAFVVGYIAVELATLVYQLDGLGITLWGPTAGMSLVFLLTAGLSFAPFVVIAAILSDFIVYDGPKGVLASVGTGLVLAGGFSGLALILRKRWTAVRQQVADVAALLVVVPVGVFIISALYCSILLAAGLVSPWRFLLALRNLWIGDTLGIITILPAVAVVRQLGFRNWFLRSRANVFAAVACVAMICGALWLIFGLQDSNEYQFFYLLFLPIVWIAMRWGYAGVAIALLIVHVILVTTATYLGYGAYDFIAFQMLMLVLSGTGLLLGAAITDGRFAQEHGRIQQQDLARASRQAIIGATGTAIAHEISQPLASATTYLHVALRKLRSAGHDPKSVEEALEQAQTEARRARETLERVRDYVSSGRLDLTEVDVELLAHKLANLMSSDAKSRGVSIDVAGAHHLPAVQADRIQLEQLMLNLLSNAVDAAAEHPGSRGQVQVRIAQRRDQIEIVVEDNGVGIEPDISDRMFEPFETSKKKGMGLGLTLVRQIGDAHGGKVGWQSVEPRGTRFVVELPIDGPHRHGR